MPYCVLYKDFCEDVVDMCLSPEEDVDIVCCEECRYCIDYDEEEDTNDE